MTQFKSIHMTKSADQLCRLNSAHSITSIKADSQLELDRLRKLNIHMKENIAYFSQSRTPSLHILKQNKSHKTNRK